MPRSARAIGAAGTTLAISFGFVALIPVAPFQELAFAMGVGVLMDAFLVRTVLVPALITLIGPFSGWPGHSLHHKDTPPHQAPADDSATTPTQVPLPGTGAT